MDYFGEIVALGIDSIIVAVCFKLYIRNRNAVKLIQEVPVHNVGSELEDIVQAHPDKKLPYVAVRGTVKAISSPIKSFNIHEITGVVQKLSIKEHVVTRSTAGFWADQERTIQEVYNYVPFVLCSNGKQVEVIDAMSADLLDLDTIADKFEPSSPGFVDHVWGFFTGVRQRGLQTKEDMLREGVLLTGVGELTLTGSMAELKLQPPNDGTPFYLTALPLSTLARRLDHQRKMYKLLTALFGGIGLAVAVVVARRWWQDRARRINADRVRRVREDARRERRSRMRDKDVPEAQLCVVCRLHPRELILLPCGHVCLCEDCGDNISDKCPVCRADIEKKEPAYLA